MRQNWDNLTTLLGHFALFLWAGKHEEKQNSVIIYLIYLSMEEFLRLY